MTLPLSQAPILIVDDESSISELLRMSLRREGFETVVASDGPSAIAIATQRPCQLIILDVILPGMSGHDVFRTLRADSRTARVPVIMLSGQSAEPERVQGLELGADDYVTKPFSPRELVARVRAVLRRAQSPAPTPPSVDATVINGQLLIDPQRHEIRYAGTDIQLTACEFRVLLRLANSPGVVLSREQLGAAIDQTYASLDRTIDAHIKAIRRKLGPGGDEIETVRGFGYRLRAPGSPARGSTTDQDLPRDVQTRAFMPASSPSSALAV